MKTQNHKNDSVRYDKLPDLIKSMNVLESWHCVFIFYLEGGTETSILLKLTLLMTSRFISFQICMLETLSKISICVAETQFFAPTLMAPSAGISNNFQLGGIAGNQNKVFWCGTEFLTAMLNACPYNDFVQTLEIDLNN